MKSAPNAAGRLVPGRRVRLVVRRVEPWTVLKFSVMLFATLYLVFLVAGAVLWAAATATGLRHNIEKFIGDLIASDNFHILGGTMFRASVLGGFVMVVLGTGANVLFAVLYNLISDVIGGITVVFEERPGRRRAGPIEVAEPAPPKPPRAERRRRAFPTPADRALDSTLVPGRARVQPESVEAVELTGPAAD
jgi:hypothetical protein